jgi:hypothetical protein
MNKIAQSVAQSILCSKHSITLTVKKVGNKCGILFVNVEKLPKVNRRQMGEKLPNLVTLICLS